MLPKKTSMIYKRNNEPTTPPAGEGKMKFSFSDRTLAPLERWLKSTNNKH